MNDHNHRQVYPEPKSSTYACPMHPEIIREKPGRCPECGMNLVPEKISPGKKPPTANEVSGKHAGHSTAMFFKKFWVSLILTMPVVLYADIVEKIFKWSPPRFPGSAYLPLVFGSVVFFYGGWVFLAGAIKELRARLPGMMTLIGLAITTAYLWSVYATFSGAGALFWELTTLITIMLLGHWLEMRAVSSTQGALKELSKLIPDTAEIIRNGKTEKIALSEVRENDALLVRPGAKIPADGLIIEGESDINESMITGESNPVSKKQNSGVIAGTINGDGALKIRVTNIGEKTFLAGVMRLIAEAQASKSRLQILSDKAAFYLTFIAVFGGLTAFISWLLAGAGISFAVARLVAVFVIACPHALGLAVPLVASISTTKAAKNGFLVKRRLALEAARKINVVLFDKTGTLTKGEFGIAKIISAKPGDETRVLQYAASANSRSEHPLAKAMIEESQKRNIPLLEVKNFRRVPGKGILTEINGLEVLVGNKTLAEEKNAILDKTIEAEGDKLAKEGKTINFIIVDKQLIGAIALADVIREESRETIKVLKEMGVRPAMITGDSENVAKWVARELGLDEYFSRVLPGEKSEKVKMLQKRGFKVAMVGDGINDAPALTQADLGIAIGAGTNVAIESAGIILVKNDPRDIVKIIKLSRLTYVKMIQNLFWATGYNIIALPLAAGALAFRGILLQPALAALFMSLSTVIVAINAVLLKNKML